MAGALLVVYGFCLPAQLFTDPCSTVIEDREGRLLGARIAGDGQWRFPQIDSVPYRFEKALLIYEDRFFYYHPGVNPLSVSRALIQNLRQGRRVSGGSTLSMQLIRLSRKGRPRNLQQKLTEMVLATRLELRYSKSSILRMYSSHAPFGGNVVGLDAASWRYFARSPHQLSWAEAATLAVLPNAPSLIFPGKNQQLLLQKRNLLLERMHQKGIIDALTLELSIAEPLPGAPYPLPMHASHLLSRIGRQAPGQRVRTTIDPFLQMRAGQIAEAHHQVLQANGIHNVAALVAEVKTGNVLAYIGNIHNLNNPYQGHQVDVITSARSTGSILKPLLFALMMEDGSLLPNTLVPDIPTQIAGYSPKNYFLNWDGAVPARRSLSRSLNVPSVRMLREYGVEKFHHELKKAGMTTLIHPPGHYGLSLILGGAEGTLWDLAGIYASMSRVLANYFPRQGRYNPGDFHGLNYLHDPPGMPSGGLQQRGQLSAASIWLTYQALIEVNRPEEDSAWELYSSGGKIAWKTGTSFGGRDAWAIGTTRDHVVGVWVGNATGEGRPDLTGVSAAAPVMFHLFDLLPPSPWFEQPFPEMELIASCRHSGHRAGMYCTHTDSIWIHPAGLQSVACPYHILVHLDEQRNFRLNSHCAQPGEMISQAWFVLPPVMEWYYRRRNPSYRPLPPYRHGCNTSERAVMEMIYPRENTSIFVPRLANGSPGEAVFEVAHPREYSTIYWHLNEQYIGLTRHIHQKGLAPSPGFHTLTLIDEEGNSLVQAFEIKAAR